MTPTPRPSWRAAIASRRDMLATVAAMLGAGAVWQSLPAQAGGSAAAVALPPPEDDPAVAAGSETTVLAGGCFWGVQGVFQHVAGVSQAVSGYAGGEARSARYDAVGAGTTGHAEAVRITHDPQQVSFGRLLQIFFSVVHDPTQLDRQGPDVGPQYRSAVFAQNAAQARIARAYIARLDAAQVFRRRLATVVEQDRPFYPAEAYHQDFLSRHPRHPYIVAHDLPKLADLQRTFPTLYRASPALVGRAG